jgi:hypothetical protein
MDQILSKFYSKMDEIETKNCLACNYTMQSQKGHSCWKWHRSVTNEDKYMFGAEAIDMLNLNKKETDFIIEHVEAELKVEPKIVSGHSKDFENSNREFVKVASMETQYSSQEFYSQECSLIGSNEISDSEMNKSFF